MLEQAALDQEAQRVEAEKRRDDQSRLLKEQMKQMEELERRKALELAVKEEERLEEEARQRAEDRAISEERRRILETHAPLLVGFLPPGIFRDIAELPASVHDQFRRIVRIQDDPDLW